MLGFYAKNMKNYAFEIVGVFIISMRFFWAGYLDLTPRRISSQCHYSWFGKFCPKLGRLLRLNTAKLKFPLAFKFHLGHPINSLPRWNMHFLPLHSLNPPKNPSTSFFVTIAISFYLLHAEEFQKSSSTNQRTVEKL